MKQKTVTGILVVMVLGAGAIWGLWYGGGSDERSANPGSPSKARHDGLETNGTAQEESPISQEPSQLLESVKNLPEGPERASSCKKIQQLAFYTQNYELAARAYQFLLQEGVNRGQYSIHLASLSARSYSRAGQPELAIECLEKGIDVIREGKLDLGSRGGFKITTDDQRAAVAEEFEGRIEEIRRQFRPDERSTQEVPVTHTPVLGVFREPPDLTPEQKVKYAEAEQARDDGDYTKAETILVALGDNEAAAAVLARQAREAGKASAFDVVMKKYPNTSQAELALYYQALQYKKEENAVASRAALNEYLKKYPEGLRKPDVLLALAEDAEREGRVDDELKYVEKVHELCRSRKGAQIMVTMQLKELYRKTGDTESLKSLLESSIEDLEDKSYQVVGMDSTVSDFERASFAEMFRRELAELKQREEAAAQGKK